MCDDILIAFERLSIFLALFLFLKFEKKDYPKTSTYALDYKPFPGAKPDVVLRRKLIASADGHGTKNLIGMHNFDSSKNYITL